MQQISGTLFYKWLFPVWFGSIAVVSLGPFVMRWGLRESGPFVLGWSLFLALACYGGMKVIGIFDMVDEVLDAGEALIVRKGDRVERVLLADIIDAYYYHPSRMLPRVTLKLRTPSQFGDQLTFWPLESFWGPSPVIEALIRRIRAARVEASNTR